MLITVEDTVVAIEFIAGITVLLIKLAMSDDIELIVGRMLF